MRLIKIIRSLWTGYDKSMALKFLSFCVKGINNGTISIKDYAKQKGVTYEAIRKQISRYKNELEGHIVVDHRRQLLDETAVAILDKHREEIGRASCRERV